MVNVPSTAQSLSNDYTGMGKWIGLATDDPGSTSAPANEVASDGYARQPTEWNPSGGGVNHGKPVTFTLPAGSYSYMLLCAGPDPADAMIDYCKIDATLNGDGVITVVPQYTQT